METPMASTDQRKLPDAGIDGDRLSSLPDEILSHILSSLETRLAVRTAVLSRRWKDLWTRVSNLDLDNYTDTKLDLCGILERVLGDHKNLNPLKRFRLHFSGDSWGLSPKFSSKMEMVAASQELEEIDIGFTYPSSLPDSFYTLNNLKVVKLGGVWMTAVSDFLPNLKILQLYRIYSSDYKSLSRFISGCPVLETAHLMECSYASLSDIRDKHTPTASLPSLKSLTFIGHRDVLGSPCPVVIEAPCLERLKLQDSEELEIIGSCPLSRLESVMLDISYESQISDDSVIVLFTRISNAKQMWLSCQTLIVLSRVVKDVQLPVFPNLIHLTIDAGGSRCGLLSLLSSASKLRTLVIHLGASGGGRTIVWEDAESAFTPECLVSSLQQIEIHDLPTVNEAKMVAYLLNAGAVLKNVNMHLSDSTFGKEERRVLASLLKEDRARVKLIFFIPTSRSTSISTMRSTTQMMPTMRRTSTTKMVQRCEGSTLIDEEIFYDDDDGNEEEGPGQIAW